MDKYQCSPPSHARDAGVFPSWLTPRVQCSLLVSFSQLGPKSSVDGERSLQKVGSCWYQQPMTQLPKAQAPSFECLNYSNFSRFQGLYLLFSLLAPRCPQGSCKRHLFGLLVRIRCPVLPQHGLICVPLTALNPICIYSPRDHPSLPSPRRTGLGSLFSLLCPRSPAWRRAVWPQLTLLNGCSTAQEKDSELSFYFPVTFLSSFFPSLLFYGWCVFQDGVFLCITEESWFAAHLCSASPGCLPADADSVFPAHPW